MLTDLSNYLLPCDIKFYQNYALPIINKDKELFDLDEFESILQGDESISKWTISEAYNTFEYDTDAQYELHPRFGRYVWDLADQWYQKWNVVFSVEHMWNWRRIEHGITPSLESLSSEPLNIFDASNIQPWLTRIIERYNVHPDHQNVLQDLCRYIGEWHQNNRSLTLKGSFKLNTMPLFPPTWFLNKTKKNNSTEGLTPSFMATFAPPYQLDPKTQIPERWNQVFLKGLTVDPNQKFNLDPILIASAAVPILGLTVHFDVESGYSKLMLVMTKAKFGDLEDQISTEIPTDYMKPCQLALSITKDIKDLHWNYIHGNIHPRNVLLYYADYVGELVDITFMRKNTDPQTQTSGTKLGGRWPYVAPEVVSTGFSAAADIYALGIIIWQLISRVTFPGDTLIDPHVFRIEPIPCVLKDWEDLYIDCLHTNPAKRPSAYLLYRRLTNLYNKLRSNPTPIANETASYIRQRRHEIDQFLTACKSSPTPTKLMMMLQHQPSTSTISSTSTTTGVDAYTGEDHQHHHTHDPILPTASTSSNDSNDTTSSNTLCQVGNMVLTASVTRPSHQRLKSYPNLIQDFPDYSQ
ncbi:kinase-like domain-containing protein [Mycotypha africana]|uniref:kinase-like domain-containing protein n=1 Tax=Mycotypha africana TaxID=64632 RepID=UPI0023011BC1|nr:kinase-like domain-containing protein [Mycotypha africana]KAI8973337.1 kinase-like domain-containing protein [Mycotypha africana]